ncbi:MAG: hypothetical protein KGJ13_06125 [Patescibacteria group bacterium]|nr:hypothetical protein [Patescibacteria group bacterium]
MATVLSSLSVAQLVVILLAVLYWSRAHSQVLERISNLEGMMRVFLSNREAK